MVSHCFNLHFPDNIQCGAPFHMFICIFFGEVSVKVFVSFFKIRLFVVYC